jgi:hypothetical protein
VWEQATAEVRAQIAAIEDPIRESTMRTTRVKFTDDLLEMLAKPPAERTPYEAQLAYLVDYQVTDGEGKADIGTKLKGEKKENWKKLKDELAKFDDLRPRPIPFIPAVTDVGPVAPEVTIPGRRDVELIPPGPLSVLDPDPLSISASTSSATTGRRTALAKWIASPDNPLTARVIVNRLWQKHFGRGLVSTLENFGKMGEAPTHPELLDWLAVEFMRHGWSIKQANRLMMTSQAYQMAAVGADGAATDTDPENRYLWRFRPQRLDAEIVRDSMLTVGGNVNLAVGGEPIFPFIPKDILTGQYRGKWVNTPDGPAAWRRGVYVYRRRSLPYPMFDTFDHPDMNVVAGARNVSTVPTQALTLLNNPFVLSQAERLSARVSAEARSPEAQAV